MTTTRAARLVRGWDLAREQTTGGPAGPAWFVDRCRLLHEVFTSPAPVYPCHFAGQGETLGTTWYTYCTADPTGHDPSGRVDGDEIGELARALRAFLALDRTPPRQRVSLLCLVGPPTGRPAGPGTHADDRRRFWDVLGRLTRLDGAAADPADTGGGLDPDDPSWNFRFAGEDLFCFGASPGFGPRRSRVLGDGLVLAFQPMSVFTDMSGGTALGRAAKRRIRARLREYDDVPLLADAGASTGSTRHKWKQYFPRADGAAEHGANPIADTDTDTADADAHATVTVRELDSADDIDPAAWHGLANLAGNPFYTLSTLSAYEHSGLGSQRAVHYLLAHRRDRLVAGVPLYLLDGAEVGGVLGLPELAGSGRPALLSHFPHCYDTVVPADDTLTVEVADELVTAMTELARRDGAGVCGFMNVVADSSTRRVLAQLPAVAVRPGSRRWHLDLTGIDHLDDYTAGLGRSTRRTLRAARRRADALGVEIDVTTAADGDRYARALDDAVAHCLGSARRHRSRYYPSDALADFLRRRGDVHVVRVQHGDRVLAASLCFLDGGVLHTWAGGADYPEELNWSPNAVLLGAEIEYGLRVGASRVECGRRNDEYKRRHGLTPVELVTCLVTVRP